MEVFAFFGFPGIFELLMLCVMLCVVAGVPASIIFVGRYLRYAYVWAAIVAMLCGAGSMLTSLLVLIGAFMSEEAPIAVMIATVVVLVVGTLVWTIVLGVHATFTLRRLDLGHPEIDAVSCVRYRTRKPPITWSPKKLLTTGAFISGPIVFAFLAAGILPNGWFKGGLILVGAPAMAIWLWPLARRSIQASAKEARLRDWRAPVLLLRSFKDDMLELKPPWYNPQRRNCNFEELLTGQLWCQGPVIAIGRPGESVPPIGAARDYFSDDTWQAKAERFVHDADTIVMLVGATEGLGWEVRRIQSLGMLPKLALVFPPVSRAASSPRWKAFCNQLGELVLVDSLRSLPSPELLVTAFCSSDDFVSFTLHERRNPQAYRLALGAALQVRGHAS